MPSNILMVDDCYYCHEKFCSSSSCPHDKLPALLGCQHLVCYGCIQQIWVNLDIDDNNKLQCPVCNTLTFLSSSTYHISFYFNKFCSKCAIKNGQIGNKLNEKRAEQTPTIMIEETNHTSKLRNSCSSINNVQSGIGDINISERFSHHEQSNSSNKDSKNKGKQIVKKSHGQSSSKKLHKKRKEPSKKTSSQSIKKVKSKNRQDSSSTDESVTLHQPRTHLSESFSGTIEKEPTLKNKNSPQKEISEKNLSEEDLKYGRVYSRLSSSSNSSIETDLKTNVTPNSEIHHIPNSAEAKSSIQKDRRKKENRKLSREGCSIKQERIKQNTQTILYSRECLQISTSLNIVDLVETCTSTSTQSLPNMSLSSCKNDAKGKNYQNELNATNATCSNLERYQNGGVRGNSGSLSDDSSNINPRKTLNRSQSKKLRNKLHWKMKSLEDDSDTECIPPLRKRGFAYQTECFKVLDCIYNNEKSELFRHEIKSKDVSDYYKVVKRGMCLDIIAYKIRNNIYTKVKEFSSDMYRIFDNCRLYNPYGSEAYEAANIVQNLFNDKMIECFS
ncbi:transcription initiation factor TFIID subunit 1-like [Argonauta hians]